jgi:signal transduction histidine kinase
MQRWPFLLVAVLIVVLGILATLQIRWINEVSKAHEQRTRVELATAAARFNEEIDRHLVQIIQTFEVRDISEKTLAERYNLWRLTARNPHLLAGVQVVEDPLVFGLDPQRLAMVIPVGGEREGRKAIVAQIDVGYLARDLFPDLSRRFFEGFDVAVAHDDSIVYRSNASWPVRIADAQPDGSWPMFLLRRREERMRSPVPSSWTLLVRHHGEPLAQAVAAARHRDLAVAFAILLLLGASLIILAMVARRADRLRQQQLEFVAGITHELNTPLAALASAGQNLTDGVAADTVQYGEMIVKETHRLIDLVDQVLQGAGAAGFRDGVVQPGAAIGEALSQCQWLAEQRGVRLETHISETLPAVRGDAASIARAVQNLVANAIRHGGEGGWVGVRAAAEDGFVDITVEDRGPGIAAVDLPHLFEPFYRGRNAQTRGSGLGLTIVDRIARAHGGTVTVRKGKDRGAAFMLRLPVSP